MIAPKPMLMISDGDDWTITEPDIELPFLKRTYSFYDAEQNVENVHFPDGVHDYNYAKRVPVYRFLARHLGLDINAVSDAEGAIDESLSLIENPEILLAFSSTKPFPANALRGREAIEEGMNQR